MAESGGRCLDKPTRGMTVPRNLSVADSQDMTDKIP